MNKFVDNLKNQINQNPELKKNMEKLEEQTKKLAENDAFKTARDAFQKAKVRIPQFRMV